MTEYLQKTADPDVFAVLANRVEYAAVTDIRPGEHLSILREVVGDGQPAETGDGRELRRQ